MPVILFIIVCLFVFVVTPSIGNRSRPFNIGFVVFLTGVILIWLVLRTKIVEEITSNKFIQIIIKIILVIAGAGIIVFSYSLQ